jgi:hypothetical protein
MRALYAIIALLLIAVAGAIAGASVLAIAVAGASAFPPTLAYAVLASVLLCVYGALLCAHRYRFG